MHESESENESEVSQSCLTLSDPMDCSPPGSSVHGILQARVLKWGAIAFSTTRTGSNQNTKECKNLSPSSFPWTWDPWPETASLSSSRSKTLHRWGRIGFRNLGFFQNLFSSLPQEAQAPPHPPPPIGPRVRTTAGEVFWAASLLPPFEAKTDPSCSCGVSLQLPPQEEQII